MKGLHFKKGFCKKWQILRKALPKLWTRNNTYSKTTVLFS